MCENMKFISSADQDISRVSKANEISCSTREIYSYFPGIGKDVRHAHMAYKAKIWRIIKPLTAPRLRLCRK